MGTPNQSRKVAMRTAFYIAVFAAILVAAQASTLKEDCDCPNGCSGNGACVGGVCKCAPGWTYYDCSLRVCPSTCSDHGFCFNGTCHCHPGYKGPACAIKSCPPECSFHGTCRDG